MTRLDFICPTKERRKIIIHYFVKTQQRENADILLVDLSRSPGPSGRSLLKSLFLLSQQSACNYLLNIYMENKIRKRVIIVSLQEFKRNGKDTETKE